MPKYVIYRVQISHLLLLFETCLILENGKLVVKEKAILNKINSSGTVKAR